MEGARVSKLDFFDREEAIKLFQFCLDSAIPQLKSENHVTMATGNEHIGIYIKISRESGYARDLIQVMARFECALNDYKPVVDGDISSIIKAMQTKPPPERN
jgi:hypothetical protein